MSKNNSNTVWSKIITPSRGFFSFEFKELIEYRDLLMMFVKRDIVTVYKQTVLGPIWFVAQPIMTMLTYVLIFGKIAGLSTDGIPAPLFYFSGIIIWTFFSDTLNQSSMTFSANANLFGKVYFPRIIIPLSQVVSGLIKFGIQFTLFVVFYLYYFVNDQIGAPSALVLLVPLLLLIMAMIGLGLGLLLTSMMAKYRDLKFLLQFGVQLLMYASAVIFPMSSLEGKLKTLIGFNPIAHVVEAFKYIFTGKGEVTLETMVYSSCVAVFVFVAGVLVFNKTERNFMDTV